MITRPVDDSVLTTLRGNVHPLARPQFDHGPAPVSLGAQRQVLVLKRSPQREMELQQYLASLEDKNSANFRRFLTPAQFGERYGAAPEDVEKIVAWIGSQGMAVNKIAASRMAIEFSGSVGQFENAFHTQIDRFVIGGQEHLANISNPSIPAALVPVVAGISPINDFYPRAQAVRGPAAAWSKAERRFQPQLTVNISNTPYLFVSPGDAATIYDSPTALNAHLASGQATYDGTGVTIGIVTDGGVDTTHVASYRALFKLPPASIATITDGNSPGNGDDLEATLDAEVAGAIAPGASLVYYQAADTTFQSGVMLASLRAIDDNTVNILNVSYASCELAQGAAGNQEILNMWEQAAAQGIAVTVASGDSGSAGCDDAATQFAATHGFAVNALASTPYTVAVGGTDFDGLADHFAAYASTANTGNYTSALGYIPENPWNNSSSSAGNWSANQASLDYAGNTSIMAGGGGASSAGIYDPAGNVAGGYAKPQWQQQYEAGAGIAADAVRDLPDVSLLAANGIHGAMWATCSATDCTGANPTITGVGGTSAAAPAFAGVLALVNQKLGAGQRLGQPNWVLYQLAKSHPEIFHAMESGNNAVVCGAGAPDCAPSGFLGGYNALGSYNLATGLGSVDIAGLVNDWSSVGKTQTATSLSLSATSFQHGQPIAVTVSVNPSAATGNVTLSNDIAANGVTGNSSPASFTLANGEAGGSVAELPGGTYNVYADYGGDGVYGGSISSPVEITVTPEASVLELTVSTAGTRGGGTSLAGKTISYGTYVSVDAAPVGKTQAASANPLTNATGTVTFTDSNAQGAAGSGMLDATGNAEFPLHYLGAGVHTVTASYWGDASYNPSSSAGVTFTIARAAATASVSTNASSIDSGSVTVTAAIAPNAAGTGALLPTGTVTFTDATSHAVLGVVGELAQAQNSASGAMLSVASLAVPVSQLTMGSNNIVATYAGDANYQAAVASAPAVVDCVAGCGNGTGQTLSLSYSNVTPASASTATGSTAAATVSVTPGGGFTGGVSLTCTVIGKNRGDVNVPKCSFSPVSVTIAGVQAEQSTLTVTTVASGSSASDVAASGWPLARSGAMLACILFLGLPGRRRSLAILGVFLCAFALGGMMACGGSAGAANPSPAAGAAAQETTPDTYTVTLHAADAATGTLTAQTSFTLSVN